MSKLFAFLDIETTGLDPDKDDILEIAWFLTDQTFTQITPDRTYLTAPALYSSYVAQEMKITESVVYEMHASSGLLEALALRFDDQVTPTVEAHRQFARDINSVIQPGDTLHLAGMSVHFDKAFLREEPGWDIILRSGADDGTDQSLRFHHRMLDLTATKLLYEVAGRDLPEIEKNPNPHRAINDCHEGVDMARALTLEIIR